MKKLSCFWHFIPLLIVNAQQPQHWAERELPASAIEAIRKEELPSLVDSVRSLSPAQLNAALITACRSGKLGAAKTLVNLGANPGFVVQRHPAAAKESPLSHAIASDNSDLIAYLLPLEGALHVEKNDHCLELGTAAALGRVNSIIMVLDALRKNSQRDFQQYLEDSIVVAVWNNQELAAIAIVSKHRQDLPEKALFRLRKKVAAMGGSASSKRLDDVWRRAR